MRSGFAEFNPLADAERGMLAVRARTRSAEGQWTGLVQGRDPFNVPVGKELVEKAWQLPGNDRTAMSESTAVMRYLSTQGVDVRDVIDEMLNGQDIGATQISRWIANTGLRPLFSPIVEDGLRLGMNRIAAQWSNLVAREIPVASFTYEYYIFSDGTGNNLNPAGRENFALLRVAQGAPVPVATVSVSGKSYTLFKKGRGIEWTDEAKLAPIDLAQMWFQQVGLDIGWTYHDEVIDALLNGYFGDGTDAAPVISTATPGVFTDADLYIAQATHQQAYGYSPDVLLASIATGVGIKTMENGAGMRLFPNGLPAAGLPDIQNAATVPSNKLVFVDTGFAIIRFVNKEFGTEFDRVPQSGIEGSYGTSIDLFTPFMPAARIILAS